MKSYSFKLLLFFLFLSACCASQPREDKRFTKGEELAYVCFNNARLCKKLIQRLDVAQVSSQDIKNYLLAEQHAWQEMASSLAKQ